MMAAWCLSFVLGVRTGAGEREKARRGLGRRCVVCRSGWRRGDVRWQRRHGADVSCLPASSEITAFWVANGVFCSPCSRLCKCSCLCQVLEPSLPSRPVELLTLLQVPPPFIDDLIISYICVLFKTLACQGHNIIVQLSLGQNFFCIVCCSWCLDCIGYYYIHI